MLWLLLTTERLLQQSFNAGKNKTATHLDMTLSRPTVFYTEQPIQLIHVQVAISIVIQNSNAANSHRSFARIHVTFLLQTRQRFSKPFLFYFFCCFAAVIICLQRGGCVRVLLFISGQRFTTRSNPRLKHLWRHLCISRVTLFVFFRLSNANVLALHLLIWTELRNLCLYVFFEGNL